MTRSFAPYIPTPNGNAQRILDLLQEHNREMRTHEIARATHIESCSIGNTLAAAACEGYVTYRVERRAKGGIERVWQLGAPVPTPRHAPQAKTWRRAPLGNPMPHTPARSQVQPVVAHGIASGIDQRYQVDPATFAGGEFSRLGVGRYLP